MEIKSPQLLVSSVSHFHSFRFTFTEGLHQSCVTESADLTKGTEDGWVYVRDQAAKA